MAGFYQQRAKLHVETGDYQKAEKVIDEIDDLTMNRNIDTARGKVLVRKGKRLSASDN